MSRQIEQLELVERYCNGQMSPVELSIFEQWLSKDPELVSEVEQYRELTAAFGVYAERREMRDLLSRIDAEMEDDRFRYQVALKKVPNNDFGSSARIRQLFSQYRWKIAAASIAILLLSAGVGLFGIFGAGGSKTQSAYQELRREVETIKLKQNALISNSTTDRKENITGPVQSTYTGTGVVIDKQGYLLTSHHVVADAKSIHVSNGNLNPFRARVVYSNPRLDLAVLQVEEESFDGFPDLPYSLLRSVADPGEKVYTLGFPREDMVFGEGSVSSLTGFEGDTASYQISIPVNPGNSGGPLFDSNGNLLGLISGRNTIVEGASFAVKSSQIVEDIQREGNLKLEFPARKTLKGLERTKQVKKISEFVFMVHVSN